MSRNLAVNASRIAEDIVALAEITEPGHPWTRRAFSPLFLEGRTYLEARMKAAGLETRIDAAGNLIGRRTGRKPWLGTIMLGSHSDTVPDGGRFDGIVGVIAALEVARALSDQSIELEHDLEIVDFLAEEVSIFGVSCIGSRGMTGQLPEAWLSRVNGDLDLAGGIAQVGGEPGVLQQQKRPDIAAFLELHIEQGPVLEAERKDIGIVTAIAGITRIEITVEGRADHAGTTPMDRRADALVAASQLVLDIRNAAAELAKMPGHFAATVGEFRIEPNAANVVPSKVVLLIDGRAEIRADMEAFCRWLDGHVEKLATAYGVTIATPKRVSDNQPTPGDAGLLSALEAACERVGAKHRRMASGAGHDTAWIAKVAPAAMIFVPCRGGRSHCADEWADNDDIALGAAVLFEAVREMDKDLKREKVDGTHTG
ncbi:allantoate amidohydrolase protein [Rhizobium phaseoli]|uniref:Allantoate amidohydrolase protein n=2 Tax=Rhizobium TaxID=379 RepID=A0A192T504_9HYPH|nr:MULTISPECIES: Zn-dependent hydrolase [Rhizobium]ACE89382.1 probable N-carbamoyl-L-amino acid hydrolase protein [Rhizobium etli CIAT 652]MDH6647381.1 N-carbamoyl-L-amino-acid hydrolase [Rhizobium esperanzae]ANL26267.1 allantoate amidohydrolase protein [Rhizobium phaseoli]ANL38832.1 allantoate amidohydrolase protein [Rhizobium phaseoli]ANL51597.1 allantoate amidohydrolase protein [Rhizobium phaseoli]